MKNGCESYDRQTEVWMKRDRIAGVALLALIPFWGAAQLASMAVVADITFEFHAAGKVLPAGTYEFKVDDKLDMVSVTNTKTRNTVTAPVLTRISPRPGNEALVVFDKVQDRCYLSELYVPGIDGIHFTGAPGPHTHVSVKARK
jgi:hypothetical protein